MARAPVRLRDAEAEPPEAPLPAYLASPPLPAKARLEPFNAPAAVAFNVSLKARFEAAAPPWPAVPPVPYPPKPPRANWARLNVPPVVAPPTMLVSVLEVPAPPLAP